MISQNTDVSLRTAGILFVDHINNKNALFKDGFPLIFEYFYYRKGKQLYGYFVNMKEVLSFPVIPPMSNNSKDKCPNDKNQFGI